MYGTACMDAWVTERVSARLDNHCMDITEWTSQLVSSRDFGTGCVLVGEFGGIWQNGANCMTF